MNHVTYPLGSADIIIFHWKSANFTISTNTNIDCINNFLTFLEHLKIALINMVTIWLMSAKMTAPPLLKIKVMTSSTKFYHVIHVIL